LQVAALPVSTFVVQALLSLQLVGQLPGGSHVSLPSTTPLPHIGMLPLDELDELALPPDDEPLTDDEDALPPDDDELPDEEDESPEPPMPPASPLKGSLMMPVQPLDMTTMTPKMSVPAATLRT
jgi:hypothetical protein